MCWREHLTLEEKQKLSGASKTDLISPEYVSLIRSLPRSVHRIVLTGGGEPLLFKKIEPLIQIIKDTHREGHIITNGTHFAGPIIDMFVDAKWDSISISFNAASKKTYKIINGIDTYDQVIRNIKEMLHKRGKKQFPQLLLTFVIQKLNYREIVAFVRFCIQMHINSINFIPLAPHDLTLINKVNNLALTNTERLKTLEYLRLARKLAQTVPSFHTNIDTVIEMYETHPSFNMAKSNKSYWGVKYCDVVQNSIDVGADGEVEPCCYGRQIGFGFKFNVRKQNIKDIWNSKQYKEFRNNLHMGKFPSQCSYFCTFLLPNI
jgi:MoaA/NifB/PqqE/SkfB family radical SAM enzyme